MGVEKDFFEHELYRELQFVENVVGKCLESGSRCWGKLDFASAKCKETDSRCPERFVRAISDYNNLPEESVFKAQGIE